MVWPCKNCNIKFDSRTVYYSHRKFCSKNIFKICVCGKPFYSKSRFYNHKKNCERNAKKNCEKNARNEKTIFKTCDCGKSFFSKTSFYRHQKCCRTGNGNYEFLPKENYKCQEDNCSFSCWRRRDFSDHLKNSHSIDVFSEDKVFQTYEEFEVWKEQFEKSTKAAFKVSTVKKTLTGISKSFICNRSGTYTSRSTGKRMMKSQGLSKIGFNCTACIKVQIDKNSSVVKARICNLHYGHDNTLLHLRIPKSDRDLIAKQLAMGIEPSSIQKNLSTASSNELQRQHFVKRIDLRNISKAYGIDKIKKHKKIHLSENAYAEKKLQEEERIFLCEREEESSVHYPQEENCTSEKNFDLKSNLLTKATALCDLIKNCDRKDLLLSAREHMNSAIAVLKHKSVNTILYL